MIVDIVFFLIYLFNKFSYLCLSRKSLYPLSVARSLNQFLHISGVISSEAFFRSAFNSSKVVGLPSLNAILSWYISRRRDLRYPLASSQGLKYLLYGGKKTRFGFFFLMIFSTSGLKCGLSGFFFFPDLPNRSQRTTFLCFKLGTRYCST